MANLDSGGGNLSSEIMFTHIRHENLNFVSKGAMMSTKTVNRKIVRPGAFWSFSNTIYTNSPEITSHTLNRYQ